MDSWALFFPPHCHVQPALFPSALERAALEMQVQIHGKVVIGILCVVVVVLLIWDSGDGYRLPPFRPNSSSVVNSSGGSSTNTETRPDKANQYERGWRPELFRCKQNKTASKVGILVATVYGEDGRRNQSWMLGPSYLLKKAYARRHGYDLIWETDENLKYGGRTSHWVKLTAAAK